MQPDPVEDPDEWTPEQIADWLERTRDLRAVCAVCHRAEADGDHGPCAAQMQRERAEEARRASEARALRWRIQELGRPEFECGDYYHGYCGCLDEALEEIDRLRARLAEHE